MRKSLPQREYIINRNKRFQMQSFIKLINCRISLKEVQNCFTVVQTHKYTQVSKHNLTEDLSKCNLN